MEADWEIELGGDAPVIDAHWTGFTDLRRFPEKAMAFQETTEVSALAATLVRLNSSPSPVWTSKCDVWWVESFDPYELDAAGGSPLHAIACYIDLLPVDDREWLTSELALEWCRRLCARLRSQSLRSCRADLILRAAILTPESQGLGVTAYITACGASRPDTVLSLSSALGMFSEAALSFETPASYASQIQ
jgi:hypothetical protein